MFAIAEEKAALRRTLRRQLTTLSPQALRESDDALFARFLALPLTAQADTIFAFWGVPGREPETARLIRELVRRGKRVALPRMMPEHRMETRLYCPDRPLREAGFGILEPDEDSPLIPPEEIALVLSPGLCYDRQCFRLGFGGGYYDRWLARYPGPVVGLCRDLLLQDRLPVEHHDRAVDYVVTETALYSRA
ncbi:MAG: 5-formyltetrahydrofolate cyclo-ligase [Clostridium sp.]|nr:5-formyltetrahydrofolate cyclo-ligase [Clostridium sp.]